MKNTWDLIIIGLGASGMMAAAQVSGLRVLAIEKNDKPGKKVMISGKGQCNFTHDLKASEMANFYGDKKNFVKHCLNKWSPEWTRRYFEDLGVPSVVMENGKVFPESLSAYDLIRALMLEAQENGVTCYYNTSVVKIDKHPDDERLQVHTKEEVFLGKNVLIATGGQSYQVTGSTGDGYRLARMMGHELVLPHPSLAPIYHVDSALHALAGVSIPGGSFSLWREGRKLKTYTGDLLFTHKGLSGPGILNNCRDFKTGDLLKIQFSKRSYDELEADFISKLSQKGKQTLKTWMREQTPVQSIANQLFEILGVEEGKKISECDKTLRQKVINMLCQYEIVIAALGDHRIAMATAGGVPTNEIKAKTMESKLVAGLYFGGEVIDVDGDTGGYNIQWAFSSACAVVQDIIGKEKK